MKLSLQSISFVRHGGRVVLDEASAVIPGSGLTCLVGANGVGKSTLFRILTGEVRATSGKYLLDDRDVTNMSQRELAAHFAVIPQNVATPQYISVAELAALGRFRPRRALWHRLSDEDREVVRACLDRCGVSQFASRTLDQLSGGEQQRTWLAFGLAQQKDFLLLDETLGGMDFFVRRSFFQLLKDVAKEGKSVLLTSHDIDMVEEFADRVVVLNSGRISYEGPPKVRMHELL